MQHFWYLTLPTEGAVLLASTLLPHTNRIAFRTAKNHCKKKRWPLNYQFTLFIHPNMTDFHWYYQRRFHLCKGSRRCWMFLHLRCAGQSYWDASPWRFPSEHPLLLTKKPSEVFEVLKWKKNTKLHFQSRRGCWYVCADVYVGCHLLCEVIKEISICPSNIHRLRG